MNTRNEVFDDEQPDDGSAPPPSDELLAGEYVLGVLDARERQRAQVRIDAEPAFAQLVDAWEQRFSAFLRRIELVAPPAHVWPRIRTQLGWSPVQGARRGVWQSVGFWRGATAAAVAVAAAVVVFVTQAPVSVPTPTPAPVVVTPAPTPAVARAVTTLAHDDGSPAYLATIDASAGTVHLVPVPVPAVADSEGRVPELWLIPEGEAPRSLGVVTTDKAHTIEVPDDLRRALTTGSLLAISLEPPGGAPQGAPTGPIVAKGGIQAI